MSRVKFVVSHLTPEAEFYSRVVMGRANSVSVITHKGEISSHASSSRRVNPPSVRQTCGLLCSASYINNPQLRAKLRGRSELTRKRQEDVEEEGEECGKVGPPKWHVG